MGIAKTYQCYKAAQIILEDWLFCGLTVSGSVTDTYVEATLTKCNVCVPNKASAALDKVIDGRERAMKYYGYLGQSLIFTRHMHILLLFRWIKSTLENGGPKSSDRFKTPATHLAGQLLAGASTLSTDCDHKTTQEEVQKTLLSNDLSEILSNLIKLASTNSLVASQAGCNFTTFGLDMNCLYVMTEEILAEPEVLSLGWFRDENLFSESATSEREILRHMQPIRKTILKLISGDVAGDTNDLRVEGIMQSILAPTCLPSSPARKKLKNGILELLGEKGEVKNSYTLFSVTLTCLIFMKAEDGWHVSPLELRLARLSALATSLSLGIQSAKDTIQKLYDCSIVLGVKKDVLESLAERKKLYEIWEKEFATTGRLLDPWSICHIIAWITLDLQGLPSQMGRLLVLPAFLHLYVRENIEGRQLNIPILDRFIEAYHGVIFWDGRPVDLLSLSLSYERIIQRDSTAVRIIENRSKRALRDLPFFLGCRLSENNYRLDNEITRYLNVDGTDYLKLLHEVHSVLHSQTESFINGVDIQYAIMKEVESFSMEQFGSSDSKSLLSILRNPLKLQTNIAPHYIKAVAQKVKFLGCICKTPSFRSMPKSFKIRKREIHEDPGAPHVLHGTDEHGMKSIVFARFGASIPSEIVSGSNDVYVCLNVT